MFESVPVVSVGREGRVWHRVWQSVTSWQWHDTAPVTPPSHRDITSPCHARHSLGSRFYNFSAECPCLTVSLTLWWFAPGHKLLPTLWRKILASLTDSFVIMNLVRDSGILDHNQLWCFTSLKCRCNFTETDNILITLENIWILCAVPFWTFNMWTLKEIKFLTQKSVSVSVKRTKDRFSERWTCEMRSLMNTVTQIKNPTSGR